MNNISGIGEKTIELLLKKYGSFAQVKKATGEELAAVVGKAKARILKESYSTQPL